MRLCRGETAVDMVVEFLVGHAEISRYDGVWKRKYRCSTCKLYWNAEDFGRDTLPELEKQIKLEAGIALFHAGKYPLDVPVSLQA